MPYFFQKLGKMSHILSSAAIVIVALRANDTQIIIPFRYILSGSTLISLSLCIPVATNCCLLINFASKE